MKLYEFSPFSLYFLLWALSIIYKIWGNSSVHPYTDGPASKLPIHGHLCFMYPKLSLYQIILKQIPGIITFFHEQFNIYLWRFLSLTFILCLPIEKIVKHLAFYLIGLKPYLNTVLACVSFTVIKVKHIFIRLRVICIPFLCDWKAHISCSVFKNGLSLLFLEVLCVLGTLKPCYLSCKYFFPICLFACDIYATQTTFIVIVDVWGRRNQILNHKKVFPCQIIK